jgi:hypothetical protein
MMADPTRYRSIMYDLFFKGQVPVLTAEEQKSAAKRSKRPSGAAPGRHEMDALEALRAQAAQIRAEQTK